MRSETTRSFRSAFDALPVEIQQRAKQAFERFREDPGHPGLRLKKIHASEPIYSARVTRSYRALAIRESDRWIWFWIGTHSEYDRLVSSL